MGFLSWLEASSYANWIAGSAYGWVIMLSLHAIGIATIVGIMFVVNLRLLGLYKTIPCASFDKYLKIVWYGIGLNLFTRALYFHFPGNLLRHKPTVSAKNNICYRWLCESILYTKNPAE